MKRPLYLLIIFLLFSSPFIAKGQPNVNRGQAISMVKKYGLQDKFQEKDISFLIGKPEKMVNDYLKKRYDFEVREEIVKKFREKTLYVRSMKDYFELVEKNPTARQIEVNIHGGENSYKEYYKEMVKYQYSIYRYPNGALAFLKKNRLKARKNLNSVNVLIIYHFPKSKISLFTSESRSH